MFEKLEMAPLDPILGLTEAFKKDPNPEKINLGVGVFQDESGVTPTLACVREAERRLAEASGSKAYLPITGPESYGRLVRELLFGTGSDLVAGGRAVTAQTPGGTGALRVAGDLLRDKLGATRIWLSDPTWANHKGVFSAAGLETRAYPYYDEKAHGVAFDEMASALRAVPAGDVVVLHACCHNPTGFDLSPEQWDTVREIRQSQGWLPLVDFAYQGFGSGLEEDAAAVRKLAEGGSELIVASSFSKNFGLYNERVGALTFVSADVEVARRLLSQLKLVIRTNYSNPPRHGSAIVETVLEDAELGKSWKAELESMRQRIHKLRALFVDGLAKAGVSQDFSFLTRQNGMFSFSGLTPVEVDRLREEHSIYMVRSGRINVAGMREATMARLCAAVASVVRSR